MSDLILSLSHYHRHIAIYVVQIIVTMLDHIIPAVCVFYGICVLHCCTTATTVSISTYI